MRQVYKNLMAVALASAIVLSSLPHTNAFQTVTISIEKFTLGQGFIVEPTTMTIGEGETCASVVDRALKSKRISYEHTGTVAENFYISQINNVDNGRLNIPASIKKRSDYKELGDNKYYPALAQESYRGSAGWYYFKNNGVPELSMSANRVENGDVIRLQFTLFGYGADLGNQANKDELLMMVANARNSAWKSKALAALSDLDISKDTIDEIVKSANDDNNPEQTRKPIQTKKPTQGGRPAKTKEPSHTKKPNKAEQPTEQPTKESTKEPMALTQEDSKQKPTLRPNEMETNGQIENENNLDRLIEYIMATNEAPDIESVWQVVAIEKNTKVDKKRKNEFFKVYYNNLKKALEKGEINESKLTDYSKSIIGLTAIGQNAMKQGENLLEKIVDLDQVVAQGINGPIWALIAMNSHDEYEMYLDKNYPGLRLKMVEYIVTHTSKDGGWSLEEDAESSDIDLTAMALTALEPFKENLSETIRDGSEILEKASYSNLESTAQALIAFYAYNKEPVGECDISLLDNYKLEYGYAHLIGDELDIMATEQAALALTAYRLASEKGGQLFVFDKELQGQSDADSMLWIVIAIISLMLIIAAAFGFYMWRRSNKNEK